MAKRNHPCKRNMCLCTCVCRQGLEQRTEKKKDCNLLRRHMCEGPKVGTAMGKELKKDGERRRTEE